MRARRRIGFALAAVCALSLAGVPACSDSSGPRIPPEVGEYQLALVNAGGLPAIVFSGAGGQITITGATLILREDKSYRETRNYHTVYATGQITDTSVGEDGTYSLVGTQITFSIPETAGAAGLSFVGALENGVLEYTYEGIAYRYQKP